MTFSANINKALFTGGPQNEIRAKEWLYKHLKANGAADFRNKLLKLGYQAVISSWSESIILDPNIIKIVKTGHLTENNLWIESST